MQGKKDVTVSVLMGAYNPDKKQLMAAVRSIRRQTFSDWELILVDDGSDPRYAPVFDRAAAADPRIRVIKRKKNGGLGAALNDAIKAASGTYLARMDCDDLAAPERFQRQVDFLEKHKKYMWVGSNAWLFDENGRWGQMVMPAKPRSGDFLKYSPYIHSSVMFRTAVFEKCGGYKRLHRGEDYELFMRLHAMGMRGYNVQKMLLAYREDRNSYQRRDDRSRMEEVRIRRTGFGRLGIRSPLVPFYVMKPIVVGLIPDGIQEWFKRQGRKQTNGQ